MPYREALSRREQHGWTEARAKAQGPQSGTGFCPSRREAVRREQAKRDNARNLEWYRRGLRLCLLLGTGAFFDGTI